MLTIICHDDATHRSTQGLSRESLATVGSTVGAPRLLGRSKNLFVEFDFYRTVPYRTVPNRSTDCTVPYRSTSLVA